MGHHRVPSRLSVLALTVSALLPACATVGPRFSECQERIPALASGNGRVFVYSSAFGHQANIYMNGKKVGRHHAPGWFFFVDLPPADYELHLENLVAKSQPAVVYVEASAVQFVEIIEWKKDNWFGFGPEWKPVPVDAQHGRRAIQDYRIPEELLPPPPKGHQGSGNESPEEPPS